MSNIYTVKKEINGKEYIAQFNGISAALKAVDGSYIEGTKVISLKKLANYLFEHTIVEPRIKIDDFGADDIGKEVTKTINDTEYCAKFNGLSCALEAIDNSYIDGTDNISLEKLAKFLFEKVVTKPEKLTADDFDSMEEFNDVVSFAREVMQGNGVMDEFNEVIAFAREVMQGNFRDKKKSKSVKGTSED